MTFGSTGLENDQMEAAPANMEVYVRLSELAAAGEIGIDSSAESSTTLSRRSRSDGLSSSLKNHQLQQQQQQRSQQEGEPKGTRSGLVAAGSSASFAPTWKVRQVQEAASAGEPRPPPRGRGMPMPAPLRRRQAMSDVWQHQGAFRSNRKSMKSMFEEFEADLECAAREGKTKAEVGDIFSYTSVGHKHLVRDAPTEDRIAIHQAVVPTIDDADKEELGIDSIDTTPFAMFGVFDGHGGAACAEFLEKSVSTVLAHSPVLYDQDLTPTQRRAVATADSFEELEKVHNDWAHKSGDLSGSTAILSTFQDGVLVMAGVGDSAGLYVDHMGNQHNLCPQHSTSNQREVERVLSMGGTIVNNRVAGVLMPTRTIGDLDCKRALGAIVSPHPELKLACICAPPDDGEIHDEPFLVIASDGLWDVLSFAQVAFITRRGLRMLRAQERKDRQREEKLAAKSAEKLAAKAASGGGGAAAAAAGGAAPSGGGGGGEKKKKSRLASVFSRRPGPSKATSDLGSSGRSTTGSLGGGGSGGGGSNGFSNSNSNNDNNNFPGSAVLPPPAGIGPLDMSKTGWMDSSRRSFMDGSRAGPGGGYLDASIRGLDASVRGGRKAGPIAAASLDSSQYAGLRAEQSRIIEGVPADGAASSAAAAAAAPSLVPAGEGDGNAAPDLPPYVKPVIKTASEQTASVRTAGTASQNVAMQLVHAALRADSRDDISVVVVTFTGTDDKAAPGSRRPQREGSPSSSFRGSSAPAGERSGSLGGDGGGGGGGGAASAAAGAGAAGAGAASAGADGGAALPPPADGAE